VLLIAGSRAKVSDFGVVKLHDVNTIHAVTVTHHVVAMNNQVISQYLRYGKYCVIMPNWNLFM